MSRVETTRVDDWTVVARIPVAAFDRAGVPAANRFTTVVGDTATIEVSPGTEKSIDWLIAHASDLDVASHIPRVGNEPDEEVIWALAVKKASETWRHPVRPSREYPETVWSDAVARALSLPKEIWRRMETEAKVSVPTWKAAQE